MATNWPWLCWLNASLFVKWDMSWEGRSLPAAVHRQMFNVWFRWLAGRLFCNVDAFLSESYKRLWMQWLLRMHRAARALLQLQIWITFFRFVSVLLSVIKKTFYVETKTAVFLTQVVSDSNKRFCFSTGCGVSWDHTHNLIQSSVGDLPACLQLASHSLDEFEMLTDACKPGRRDSCTSARFVVASMFMEELQKENWSYYCSVISFPHEVNWDLMVILQT